MRIATLVPTFRRADKLAEFIKNHNKTSKEAKLYFVVEPDDLETQILLDKLGEKYFVFNGEYVAAINHGFDNTEEEFVLCAADDVVFFDGWDQKLLKLTKDPSKHIFGGIDEWKISMTQKHISHPLIRRSHFSSPLYHPEYVHYMCDIEFVQRGLREGCVMITPEILISHPHTVSEHLEQKNWDETYKKSFEKIAYDRDLYERRKAEFEMYEFEDLKENRVVPTRSNPVYNKTLLSIVIPCYRDYQTMKQTLSSVVKNTFYRFEIIIINDSVDNTIKLSPWETIDYKTFLESLELEDRSCAVRVFHNSRQQWVNHNWNKGARLARGQYIAFLNSDIQLSKDWDKYLISALETPYHNFTIACPFETNPHNSEPFSLDQVMMKHCPNMIKGQCFMLRKEDVPQLFPIPEEIKHWCGDNILADRAEFIGGGVVFAKQAVVHHLISQSSKKIPSLELQMRTYTDILEYEKLTKKSLDFIKKRFPDVIKNYFVAGEDKYKNPQKS